MRMHNNSHISDQIVLITSSAEQGDANSQHELGMLYVKGERVGQDFSQARFWFEKAAEQGNEYAQCNLGALYLKGLGLSRTIARPEIGMEKPRRRAMKKLNIIWVFCT
jgi:TPR repeat protein